jgi:DNA-binding MarR family transcriptional regulator
MEQPIDSRGLASRPAASTESTATESTATESASTESASTESAATATESGVSGVSGVPESVLGAGLSPLERRAWRAFLQTHAHVARRLEADLIAKNDLPLAEFDVLFQLAVVDGRRLRMNELADRALLSRAGMTRLVDRLVIDGLVGRVKCASDARGLFAVLTDRGMERLEEAAPNHMQAVRRYFLERFSEPELEQLASLLERAFPAE